MVAVNYQSNITVGERESKLNEQTLFGVNWQTFFLSLSGGLLIQGPSSSLIHRKYCRFSIRKPSNLSSMTFIQCRGLAGWLISAQTKENVSADFSAGCTWRCVNSGTKIPYFYPFWSEFYFRVESNLFSSIPYFYLLGSLVTNSLSLSLSLSLLSVSFYLSLRNNEYKLNVSRCQFSLG